MKYFLIFILTFLISLPNCGIVFSAMDHSMTISSTTNISSSITETPVTLTKNTRLDCCPGGNKSIIMESVVPVKPSVILTLNKLPTNYHIVTILSGIHEDIRLIVPRSDGPPDPTEFVSLIGRGVKNLN